MPIERSRLRCTQKFLALAFALAAVPAASAEIDRIGSFSAGDPPPCSDYGPDIAMQPGGSFLLTWQRSGCPILSTLKVRAQRFDAAGRPLAPAVELWDGVDPQVAPLPNGDFVATSWYERGLRPFTPPGIGLHRLDALGRPVGEPIVVATDSNSFAPNLNPRLAVAPNGGVAVVWLESSFNPDFPGVVRGQFYDTALQPTTGAFLVSNDPTGPGQSEPEIAFRADGTALAVWTASTGPLGPRIFGRMFSASGQPMTEVFPISRPETDRVHRIPRVVAGGDGDWWVGWYSYPFFAPPPGGGGDEIAARVVRLGAEGQQIGAEQSLGAPVPADGSLALGTDSMDNLLVLGVGLDRSIIGRIFNRGGAPASNLFDLSGGSSLSSRLPVLADRSAAGFRAAWSRYSPTAAADPDLVGAILAPACLEGKSAACLGPDGRYGVEITWQNGSDSGTAKPLPLAGNVATFGLRNAADHDVTVLLSGPGSRDLTFAATTGAKLEIRVTDKTTGTVRTFTKPAGRFASRRISDALPSGARLRVIEITRKITTSLRDVSLNSSSRQGRRNLARGFNPSLAPEPTVGETCVPTSRALCLLGGRFRAELLAGQYPNPALAILRTDQSGAFAFPSAPETPLVTLTMIDGRVNNGKFWVYLGGLSTSGYRVVITDLSTGIAKTYTNRIGRLESRADRMAF